MIPVSMSNTMIIIIIISIVNTCIYNLLLLARVKTTKNLAALSHKHVLATWFPGNDYIRPP